MATSKKAKKAAPAGLPPSPRAGADLRLDRLRRLIEILEASTLAELSYEDEDIAITISRQSSGYIAAAPASALSPAPPPASSSAAQPPPASAEEGVVVVKSPFVGTFYRSVRPGAPAFTEVGEKVRRGQTICIVEAMKLMNEIECEVDGTVVEILVENGRPVQYGDALFKIKKA
jgi:acetyl-CoA carboxylase biotin carboxyl carrier protein